MENRFWSPPPAGRQQIIQKGNARTNWSRFSKVMLVIAITFGLLSAHSNFAQTAFGQTSKKALDHSDYEKWNSLRPGALSNDGNWASFSVNPSKGSGTLTIRNLETDQQYTVKGGSRLRFSFDSKYAVYTVMPDPELLKKLRKEKKKASEFPKPKLQILDLKTGDLSTVDGVSSFSMPQKSSGWLAYMAPASSSPNKLKTKKSSVNQKFQIKNNQLSKHTGKKPKPAKKKPDAKAKDKKKASSKKKTDGKDLILRNLATRTERRFPLVKGFRFSEKGKYLAFTTSSVDGSKDGLSVFDLSEQTAAQVLSGKGNYGSIVFSKDESKIAILTDKDDYKSHKSSQSLYLWSEGNESAKKVVDHKTEGMPKGWWIHNSSPSFFEDGSRIVFRTKEMPENREKPKAKKKDTKPQAKLDLWHWKDPFLQPQQLLQAAQVRNQSYTAVYNVEAEKMVQLADTKITTVSFDPKSSSSFATGVESNQWRKMRSWDLQSFSNTYLINLDDGKRTQITNVARFSPRLSPTGKFVAWWDAEKKAYFAVSTDSVLKNGLKAKPVNISGKIPFPVFNELHDTPSLAGPYGFGGWTEGDGAIIVYSRFDIWQVDPNGKTEPICLTAKKGAEKQTRYRIVRLDPEQRFLNFSEPVTLSVLNHNSKASGYAGLDLKNGKVTISDLLVLNESVSGLRKAMNSDRVLLNRSTFRNFPDLWASTLKFESISRLSDANPQQKNYRWGSAELVGWKAKDGTDLQGILYKPDSFDPKKKYPMLVYFYERNADTLHRYTTPAAGRSIINFSFYVSRGYVVFIPDVVYKTGAPGPSAENCILPGVDSIVAKGFVDKKRIGMQGHSWGGYQTAYLVTKTDMFACAESGAPVSNMTSAYGGIRWGTGMSRMFQYEKTQSRIGATLWENREDYIKNSPVFFADKINTPLLILHNDKDTAVPWYQGIELFVAMRRLSKPAWMLNYNGDPHWVMSDANRMDFAKRMQQFFDHYLKGDPMPVWMDSGIPAVDKGKKFGFEPVSTTGKKQSNQKATKNLQRNLGRK